MIECDDGSPLNCSSALCSLLTLNLLTTSIRLSTSESCSYCLGYCFKVVSNPPGDCGGYYLNCSHLLGKEPTACLVRPRSSGSPIEPAASLNERGPLQPPHLQRSDLVSPPGESEIIILASTLAQGIEVRISQLYPA